VLLVPDEHSRAVCTLALQHGGYRVVVAENPTDVVARARENSSDLVIADLSADQRATLRDQLAEHMPGVTCFFVRQRADLSQLARQLVAANDRHPPRN
jgi:CheY-like chemotaxis protein